MNHTVVNHTAVNHTAVNHTVVNHSVVSHTCEYTFVNAVAQISESLSSVLGDVPKRGVAV